MGEGCGFQPYAGYGEAVDKCINSFISVRARDRWRLTEAVHVCGACRFVVQAEPCVCRRILAKIGICCDGGWVLSMHLLHKVGLYMGGVLSCEPLRRDPYRSRLA